MGNSVAFHTYSWRSFMVTEFEGEEFPGTPFPKGEDVLKFFEIEDTNREEDMYVLIGYCLILHLLSLVVLTIRYSYFKGAISTPSVSCTATPIKSARVSASSLVIREQG